MKSLFTNKKIKNTKQIYDKTAQAYKDYFGEEWENINLITEFIEEMYKINDKPKALELGCGWGYHANFLRTQGIDIEGLEISESFVNLAKKEFPETKFKAMNAVEIGKYYPKNSIDGIMGLYFFYFVPKEETHKLWKGISKVLKTGGLVFAVTSIGDNTESFESTNFAKDNDDKLYMYNLSEEEWKDLFVKYGFEIVSWRKLPLLEKEIINGEKKVAFVIRKIK